jgi:hypothetical protein
VPLVAAAVCPHPPLIVPQLAAGAAPELDDLRRSCDAAVARLGAAGPDLVAVVGSGPSTTDHIAPYRASFAPWGVPVEARLGVPGPDTPALPLGVAVGVWLLARTTPPPVRVVTVVATAPPAECARLGRSLARAGRVALLAMGDGSACRDLKAPGYLDPRAKEYDGAVVKALAAADPAALLALDPELSAELMVAGRAPWQVLAGAVSQSMRGEVLYDSAPYGVQYTVAVWERA